MSTFVKPPLATSITIYTIGVFLGVVHIILGLVTLLPTISADYHMEMKVVFNSFARALTFLHGFLDKIALANYLRYFVALSQLAFGGAIIENGHFVPGLASIGNFGLLALNFLVLVLQFAVKSPYERIAPTAVFTLLLITRLIIIEQSSKKTRGSVKTKGVSKPKSSTPKKNKNE